MISTLRMPERNPFSALTPVATKSFVYVSEDNHFEVKVTTIIDDADLTLEVISRYRSYGKEKSSQN